MLEKELTPGP